MIIIASSGGGRGGTFFAPAERGRSLPGRLRIYYTMLYYITLYDLWYIILCCNMLYYIILCYIILYYIIPCYLCVYVCMYVCMYVCIYIYIYIYIHTYIHMYIGSVEWQSVCFPGAEGGAFTSATLDIYIYIYMSVVICIYIYIYIYMYWDICNYTYAYMAMEYGKRAAVLGMRLRAITLPLSFRHRVKSTV